MLRWTTATLLLILFAITTTLAQVPEPALKVVPKAAPKVKPPEEVVEESPKDEVIQSVFVIVCDSAPNKILVLAQDGKWMPSVRSIDIKVAIGEPATITCTMYEGSIKPTTPKVKVWQLSQMKTVPNADFQQMVDDLQTNPDAIRAMLKKE